MYSTAIFRRPFPWPLPRQQWIPTEAGPPAPEPGVTIAGTLVSIKEGSLSITDRTEGRSVASFTVLDPTGASHYAGNETLSIRDWDSTLVFAGFIDTVREIRLAPDGYLIHEIACKDNWYLADKRVVNSSGHMSYTATAAGTIVADLRSTYLTAEGVTAGTISAGSSRTFDFSYLTVAEALERLAAAEGFVVNIDHNKALQFHSRTAVSAAWTLTEADALEGNTIRLVNNPRYRNRQIVTGGYAVTATITEIQAGDDERRTFTMPYQLANAPTVDISGGGGGTWVSQTVGELNVDSGKDFYWSQGSKEIVQDPAETPVPTPGPSGTQTARPNADIADTNWTLLVSDYDKLDEVSPNDADYTECDNTLTTDSYVRVSVANLTDPNLNSNHTVNFRARKDANSDTSDIFVRVRNSDETLVADHLVTGLTTSFATYSYVLTTAEAQNISSYTALRLEFATGTQGGSQRRHLYVSWAEFVIPASGAAAPPPAGIGWLRVQFVGRNLATVEVEDTAEIAAVAAIEGGSGKVESVYAAPGQEALPIAQALLARYGKRGIQLQVSTLRSGLKVGQNLDADLPDHGITTAKDLLIESIAIRQRGTWDQEQEFIYTVSASENVVRGGGADLFTAIGRQLAGVVEPA